jgi:ABC-type glycerol-3-phosphate transport system substrate-binding protein
MTNRVRVISSTAIVLALFCVFVPLVSMAGQAEPKSPASGPAEEAITLWKVGSPHTGNTPNTTVPLNLEQPAERMGIRITVQAFPAEGFAQKFFDAFKSGQAPDVLCFDNYGIIDGITTPRGTFEGIGSDENIRQAISSGNRAPHPRWWRRSSSSPITAMRVSF